MAIQFHNTYGHGVHYSLFDDRKKINLCFKQGKSYFAEWLLTQLGKTMKDWEAYRVAIVTKYEKYRIRRLALQSSKRKVASTHHITSLPHPPPPPPPATPDRRRATVSADFDSGTRKVRLPPSQNSPSPSKHSKKSKKGSKSKHTRQNNSSTRPYT